MAVNPSAVQYLPLSGGTLSNNLTISAGNLTVSFGNALVNGNVDVTAAGFGLLVKEGTNAKQGRTAALVAGTLTVANTSVTAGSEILLTGQTAGGTPGGLNVSSRTAGTSFTITSTNAADTSTAGFEIFEPG